VLFPEVAGPAQFEELVQFAVATVRGLATLDLLHPGGERNRQQWAHCRLRVAAQFAATASSSTG
jgi:hypothetical protein